MTVVCLFLLILCFLYLMYTWVLFPRLLISSAQRRSHLLGQTPAALPVPPMVHLVISAHNEESVIGARVANLSALDYPATRLRVHIGTDGCGDATAERARTAAAASSLDVVVHEFSINRGKVSVLKELVVAAAPAAGDVLLFSDANTHFEPGAVGCMVERMADPRVGGVCGRLILGESGSTSPEAGYWGLETQLKRAESALDSCLGANGAIYAMRAGLFWDAIPDNTIVDDFVLGMKVREAGYRMVYEPGAVAREELPQLESEWGRRVRIGAGDYQALVLCRRCLAPRFRWFAWCFFSHKVLRWFTPHVLVLGMAAALLLPAAVATLSVWSLLPLLGVCAVFALGACGVHPAGREHRICSGMAHFLTMNGGLLCGFWRWSRGQLDGAWHRTPRGDERQGSSQ